MLNSAIEASNLTCQRAMTGLGCGVTEMLVLGILFFLGSIACIFFLIHHFKLKRKNHRHPCDYSIVFFATMSLWMLFRSVISIIPFDYSITSYNIVFTYASAMLFLIPLSFIILIICNILFTYRNPGTKMIIFFKLLFFIFLIAFLLIALVLSIANKDDSKQHEQAMRLWCSCTDLIICFFFIGPAIQLVNAFDLNSHHKTTKRCLNFSIVGVALFCFLFILRILYNFSSYCGLNGLESYVESHIDYSRKTPITPIRVLNFIYYFIFDFFCGCFGIGIVVFIENKELNDFDSINEKQKSDLILD